MVTSDSRSHLWLSSLPWFEVSPLIRGNTGTHILGHTGVHIFACNCAQGVDQRWGVMWTSICALVHVHILTEVWDQMRDDWDMHRGPHRGVHPYTQLFKGVEQKWRARWAGIHALMHAHILNYVWNQMRGNLGIPKGPHSGGTFLHTTMQRGWVEKMWGSGHTCIHVLMHVHILNKVWDQRTTRTTQQTYT